MVVVPSPPLTGPRNTLPPFAPRPSPLPLADSHHALVGMDHDRPTPLLRSGSLGLIDVDPEIDLDFNGDPHDRREARASDPAAPLATATPTSSRGTATNVSLREEWLCNLQALYVSNMRCPPVAILFSFPQPPPIQCQPRRVYLYSLQAREICPPSKAYSPSPLSRGRLPSSTILHDPRSLSLSSPLLSSPLVSSPLHSSPRLFRPTFLSIVHVLCFSLLLTPIYSA